MAIGATRRVVGCVGACCIRSVGIQLSRHQHVVAVVERPHVTLAHAVFARHSVRRSALVKSSERNKICRLEDAMRFASLVAVAAFVSLTTLEGKDQPAALQAKPLPEQSSPASPAKKAPKNPYDGLFVPATPFAPEPSASRGRQPAGQTETTVVCGMRIIPVDPTIDRGIAIPPPDADRYTLRVLKPSVCTR